MNYRQALDELYSLDSPKWTLGLQRIEELLEKLGNPEKKIRCIHVAGTNGKGSVCSMIHSILMKAGYKTGLYTSPHLKRFNERIKINKREITDKEIVKYYKKVKKYVTNQSFFEITTAMAFLYFSDKNVDFVVLEVGLGGRLDATNVVTPLVSIITNIGLEHTNILGKTIEKITYEKSGIIKDTVPVITAAEGKALATIRKIANERNSNLTTIKKGAIKIRKIKEDIKKSKNPFIKNSWVFDYSGYKNLELSLNGRFQAHNAAIAIEAITALRREHQIKTSEDHIINGLKSVEWAGRLQFIEKNVIVDCAHNPHGFRILFNELKYFNYRKLIAVMGFSDDKDIRSISKIIKPLSDKIILTKSSNERAIGPEEIKKYFNKPKTIKNPQKALDYAKNIAGKEDLVLVAGSIYMIGEII